MAKGCIYTYNGKEYPETDFKNLLLSGELDDLLPKEVVDELPVVEKAAAKKVTPEEKKEPVSAEPKVKSKLAKFKEKHLSQSKTESKKQVSKQSLSTKPEIKNEATQEPIKADEPRVLRTKVEIDSLPEKEREIAIDELIYGVSNRDAFSRSTGKVVKLGKYNTADFVRDNEITGGAVAVDLLNKIAKHPYFKNVKLFVTDKLVAPVKGEALVTADIIKVSPEVTAETLAHEMMHILTSMIFRRSNSELTKTEIEFRDIVKSVVKKFDPEYKYLDKALGSHGYKRSEYLQEVIAEAFTGSEWAKKLNSNTIEVVRTKRIDKNLIQKIVDKIIEFFTGKVSDKYVTVKERQGVVDVLREVFLKKGVVNSERLKEINRPIRGDLQSNFSKEFDVNSAVNRLREAGYSDTEIASEFKKRGIKIPESVLTEEERQKRIQSLTEEKQQKINEVTKPQITFDTGLSLTDLAGTSEANRQLHDDYKSQLASIKNIINCLWQ